MIVLNICQISTRKNAKYATKYEQHQWNNSYNFICTQCDLQYVKKPNNTKRMWCYYFHVIFRDREYWLITEHEDSCVFLIRCYLALAYAYLAYSIRLCRGQTLHEGHRGLLLFAVWKHAWRLYFVGRYTFSIVPDCDYRLYCWAKSVISLNCDLLSNSYTVG